MDGVVVGYTAGGLCPWTPDFLAGLALEVAAAEERVGYVPGEGGGVGEGDFVGSGRVQVVRLDIDIGWEMRGVGKGGRLMMRGKLGRFAWRHGRGYGLEVSWL